MVTLALKPPVGPAVALPKFVHISVSRQSRISIPGKNPLPRTATLPPGATDAGSTEILDAVAARASRPVLPTIVATAVSMRTSLTTEGGITVSDEWSRRTSLLVGHETIPTPEPDETSDRLGTHRPTPSPRSSPNPSVSR